MAPIVEAVKQAFGSFEATAPASADTVPATPGEPSDGDAALE
jgi:hypothetical protein